MEKSNIKSHSSHEKTVDSEVYLEYTVIMFFANGHIDSGITYRDYYDRYEDARDEKHRKYNENKNRRRKYKNEILFYADVKIEFIKE